MCRLGHALPTALALLVGGCKGPTAPDSPGGGSPPGIALGSVTLVSQAGACAGSSDACWEVVVSCPGLAESEGARFRINEPPGQERGTALFMTGGGGRGFWSSFGADADRVLGELQEAGFRTVEIAWDRGWLVGASGALEGQSALACKPASAALWIHERFQASAPELAFCATGNSGGSAQVSYMLSHYGLHEILDLAIPSGGPPMGRMDLGCIRDDPANEPLWYGAGSASTIDRGFGFLEPGTGPCSSGDSGFRTQLEEASIATGQNDYFYPKTLVHFLFGAEDVGNAVPQGITYLERLRAEGTPLVGVDTLPGVPHAVPAARPGADRIRDLMLAECRVR